MNGSKPGSRNSRRRRLKVAPVTRAVRVALTASAAALALLGSGAAFAAGSCTLPVDGTVYCEGDFTDTLVFSEVFDLTVIFDDPATDPETGVNIVPVAGDPGVYANIDGAFSLRAYGYISTVGASAITAYATGALDITTLGGFDSQDANTIDVVSAGDASVHNGAGASTTTHSSAADVAAIRVETTGEGATAGIDNDGYAYAGNAGAGFAVALYGYAAQGTVAIDNAGRAFASSVDGIADGIFASGQDVAIGNSGEANGWSNYWAAGIQAYATGSVSIDNSGSASADALGYGGHAYGIYAVGGADGVDIDNSGAAVGGADYATGIFVQSQGAVSIDNSGYAGASNPYQTVGGLLATGIHAATSGDGADIAIDSSGLVLAGAQYGANGIEALALGEGSSAHIVNSGNILAQQYSYYGYGADGIVASANLDASIDNSGDIGVASGGLGYGALALAFNGEASVTNSGDIEVQAMGAGYTGAYGAVASSSNGTAAVDNSGGIEVASLYYGHGISASGTAGSAVTNSGVVTSDAWISYGILATAGTGDASVANASGGIVAAYYSVGNYYGQAFGIAGLSSAGDVHIQNDGAVYASILGRGIGVAAIASAGDATVGNTGLIDVYTYGDATGTLARADYGIASFDNSGTVGARSYAGSASGVQVAGTVASVTNSGDISAEGLDATGIFARGAESATVSSDGTIYAYASGKYGQAAGVYASGLAGADAYAGTVSVTTAGSIEALAAQGFGIGVFGYSGTGDVAIDNAAAVYAGGAIAGVGLYASTDGAITIDNTGDIQAGGGGMGAGMVARSSEGDIALSNGASVQASALYGPATGMSAYSIYGDVSLQNNGILDAESQDGDAIGMYAYSMYGDATVGNTGSITAYSAYGLADGIFASGATVDVSTGTDSDISATGYSWAAGIEAQGSDATTVDNGGVIKVTSTDAGSHATGIYATAGEGGLAIANSGPITAIGYYSAGIDATSGGSGSITNSGDVAAGEIYTVDYNGYTYVYGSATSTGIHLGSGGLDSALSVTNSGAITADGYFSGTGIEVVASGSGSTGSVANTGDIAVSQYTKYGYGAAGIVVSADADASITNSGAISAVSAGAAYGAMALSFNGEASVTNSGDITAGNTALKYYGAYGILASSANGTAVADNSGGIEVDSSYFGFGAYAQGTAGATATNSGDIAVTSYNRGFGVKAQSGGGNALATNAGDITVDAFLGYGVLAVSTQGDAAASNGAGGNVASIYSDYAYGGTAFGVAAISTYGDASASNAGSVYTHTGGQTYALAALSLYGNASVANSGEVEANSYAGPAAGAFARADGGTASVANTGSLAANAPGYAAYGVIAEGGAASVDNSGDIAASGYSSATGVLGDGAGGVTLDNTGSIAAEAVGSAYGARLAAYNHDPDVDARLVDGNVALHNEGSILASAAYLDAYGATAATYGDISIDNAGSIAAASLYGDATGVMATGYSVAVANDGDIDVQAYGNAIGAILQSYGTLSIAGDGRIDVDADAGAAQGIVARATGDVVFDSGNDIAVASASSIAMAVYLDAAGGDLVLDNHGDISVDAASTATGLLAWSDAFEASNSGSVEATGGLDTSGLILNAWGAGSFTNSGAVDASASAGATGVRMNAATGEFANSGEIHASGYQATGAALFAGEAWFGNSGAITAAGSSSAIALDVSGGSVDGQNSGTLAATADGLAIGARARSGFGTTAFSNSGDIAATSDSGEARGLEATASYSTVTATNSGSIAASGVTAYGAELDGSQGVAATNSGSVAAAGDDYATGVFATSYFGDASLQNSGSIHADAATYAVAVGFGDAGTATLLNSGSIVASGAGEGNIAVASLYGSPMSITNTGTISGAVLGGVADDAFANGSGGTWNVANHSTDFGDGDDVLHNLAGGTIALTNGAIHFGAGASNRFINDGAITVSGSNTIDMSGGGTGFGPLSLSIAPMADPAAPFENNGIIDFADGDTADVLTITGDFGGQGEINLDINLINGGSDLLYIDGDVVDGTQQTVNLSVDDIGDVVDPTPAQFLYVSGAVANGAFVPGEVTGFGSGNFIDLDVQLSPTTQDGTTAFSASVAVAGLNSTGVLAANIVPGAHQLIASSIGTLRQRNGTGTATGRVGAWLRVFDNDGDIDPAHSQDFGSAGDFAFSQSSHGTELGIGYDLDGPLQFGVMLGKSDATQKMRDRSGSDHFKLHSAGVYGTWMAPAFYVDASYRRMSFDARLDSSAGEQETSGDADAWNFEAGYTGWNPGGFHVVPQVQYTIARIDGIDPVEGPIADFDSSDSTSKRSRLGVEISRSFQAGAVAWTPYVAASTVNESDGKASYTIAGAFSGTTDIGGSSTLLEAGVGAQFGAFRATLGANWSDGGAQDGITGGQLVLRYNW